MARPVLPKTFDQSGLDTSIAGSVTLKRGDPIHTGFDRASTKCSGLAKAVNNYYRILFTLKGSNPLDPYEGTELPTIHQFNAHERDAVYVAVKNAVGEALEQVRSHQINGVLSLEEQVTKVDIIDFKVNPKASTLDFSLLISVASGDSTVFQLPSTTLS